MFATKDVDEEDDEGKEGEEKKKEEIFVFFCSEQKLGIKSIKT